MQKKSFVSVSFSEPVTDRLEHLDELPTRSNFFLAVVAVEEYLPLEHWQIAAIKEGIEAAARDDVVGHVETVSEQSRWGNICVVCP